MKPRAKLQIAFISLGCLGAYAAVRSVPVEACDFLHYGDYVNAEGVIEGCGYAETDFFNLDELRFPVTVSMEPQGTLRVGQETTFILSLATMYDRPLRWEDIAVSHTERLHLLVVDPTLQDYQHVHPEPTGVPGHYTVRLTPRSSGNYRAYLDFIPLNTAKRTLASASFRVPPQGEAHSLTPSLPDGYQFTVEASAPARAGEEYRFKLGIVRADGAPVTFTPVMDAFAHLVAFQDDRHGFAHLHPLNPFWKDQDPQRPDLTFAFRPDAPGRYRLWAQMILDGQQVFVPFDLEVEA